MSKYYAKSLSAERLRQCYDLAPPRIKQLLSAELEHIKQLIRPNDKVLELGCGYGRVLKELSLKSADLHGIDNSIDSLFYGQKFFMPQKKFTACCMDASQLGFRSGQFDLVLCVQNGISAFKKGPSVLIKEALRVTRSGCKVLFSSYSDKIWKERLEWFEIQAAHGLLGEIDYEQTGNGIIICKDGFRADTFSPAEFEELLSDLGNKFETAEADDSLVLCEIIA